MLAERPHRSSRQKLVVIKVGIAIANHHPTATKFARDAEIANRAAVRWRASVHGDFCAHERHRRTDSSVCTNRRKLHIPLNQLRHGFDWQTFASLRYNPRYVLRAPPGILLEEFHAHGI